MTLASQPRSSGVVRAPQLRRIRLEQALTQDELAHLARVARTTVMRAEQGYEIHPSTLRRLAVALHVKPIVLQRPNL